MFLLISLLRLVVKKIDYCTVSIVASPWRCILV